VAAHEHALSGTFAAVASRTLRPLGIGEILDAGIKVFIRHWKVLTICVVGLVGPMNVLQVLIRASIDPDAFESGSDTTSTDAGPAIAGLVGSAVLSGLAFLIAFTACFKAVADAWLGARPEVGRSLRFGARRLGSVLGTWILWTLAIVLAFLALIIPGVYLSVAWCLTLPVLLFEGGGPVKAMSRSRGMSTPEADAAVASSRAARNASPERDIWWKYAASTAKTAHSR